MFDEKYSTSEELEQKATETEVEAAPVSEETAALPESASPYEVTFTRPHTFEGKTYTSVNLEGLETMTSKDMRDAESWLTKKGIVSATPEMSMEYAVFIASRAAKLPIEFFESLHPKNAIKIKNKVTNFFYGED